MQIKVRKHTFANESVTKNVKMRFSRKRWDTEGRRPDCFTVKSGLWNSL